MALAVALILLVLGTVAFHFLSPWWFTPIASNWGYIDDTINLTFWITGVVFAGRARPSEIRAHCLEARVERARELGVERRLLRPGDHQPAAAVRREVAAAADAEIQSGLFAAERVADEREEAGGIVSHQLRDVGRRHRE